MSPTVPTLRDAGFAPEAADRISRTRAQLLGACLDAAPNRLTGDTLPLLWHWVFFAPTIPTADLGPDGHPLRSPEMNAFPQRMWVGGRVQVNRPLDLDEEAIRTSRIASVAMKEGGSGHFWLVTVAHEIAQRGECRISEEQDLVFRSAGTLTRPGPDRLEPPHATWVEEFVADPVLLFRFSAATSNAHRIHYDQPYATGVEGYPDLVVHGPLTAILLAEFGRRRAGRDYTDISFRARAPHFANRRCWLTGRVESDGTANVTAIRADGAEAMNLRAC